MKFLSKALGHTFVDLVPEFCYIIGLPAGSTRSREILKYTYCVASIAM